MALDSTKTYSGSCLCRTIQYTVTGKPMTFFVCHCGNCRKATGAAFMANAVFKRKQFVITQGEDNIKRFGDTQTGSGKVLQRSFCVSCGSNIFLEHNTGDYIIIATGTLNEEPEWVKVTKGSDHIRVYHDMDTKSGAPLLRSFCPTCSASLFIGNNKNTLTIVSLGTLDDEVDWVPRGESFTHSRRKWVEKLHTEPKKKAKL
ncbi:hypothetical protein J132_01989 [Termitomyces sp. J132]|nr:hypothetical protein J132_01989 [Termitomyces sp. J132]